MTLIWTILLGCFSGFRGGFYVGFCIHLIFLSVYFVSSTSDQTAFGLNPILGLTLKVITTLLGIASALFSGVLTSRHPQEFLERIDPIIFIFSSLPIGFYYFYF